MTDERKQAGLEKVTEHLLTHVEKQVEQQYSEVQSIRQRSYYVIAINGLILLIFSRLFDADELRSLYPLMALGAAIISIGFCVWLWLKKSEWKLYHNVPAELKIYTDTEEIKSASDYFFTLSVRTYARAEGHESIISKNRGLMELSLFFVIVQTALWCVAVWMGIDVGRQQDT